MYNGIGPKIKPGKLAFHDWSDLRASCSDVSVHPFSARCGRSGFGVGNSILASRDVLQSNLPFRCHLEAFKTGSETENRATHSILSGSNGQRCRSQRDGRTGRCTTGLGSREPVGLGAAKAGLEQGGFGTGQFAIELIPSTHYLGQFGHVPGCDSSA